MKKIIKENMWFIIDIFNKNKITSKIFVFLKKHIKKGDFKIDQLRQPKPVKDNDNKEYRYTIIIPSLRKSKVFGGVRTALNFFYGLLEENSNYDGRIIVISEEKYSKKLTIDMGEFSEKNLHRQIVYMSNVNDIDVREHDYFIFTTWGSAYSFMPIFQWQRKTFQNVNGKAIYLIQDYEPGFAAWSSWFALAESTYRTEASSIIAVFNSQELYDYFKIVGYSFAKEIVFKPMLNEKLKEILCKNHEYEKREKIIIIYGRPNEPRNAFEIIRYALKLWSEKYSSAKEWKIISMGAPCDDIELKNNVIHSLGKVSLEEYANTMLKAYAGISLMISPHPSYPPLEMSTFGIKTITNRFMNKDIQGFNPNIISLENYRPEEICNALIKLCNNYDKEKSRIILNDEYLNGTSFQSAISAVNEYMRNNIEKK